MIHFFFNDTATTEIYTLSLHDALPICAASRSTGTLDSPQFPSRGHQQCFGRGAGRLGWAIREGDYPGPSLWVDRRDRKSTRLNSSHANISYAVFCLKKKKIARR